jgi:hypothetical protein
MSTCAVLSREGDELRVASEVLSHVNVKLKSKPMSTCAVSVPDNLCPGNEHPCTPRSEACLARDGVKRGSPRDTQLATVASRESRVLTDGCIEWSSC